ncbi:hypothetical protein BDN70DRAFT_528202 [Pholiota conissans]|uniref:Mediator of RNA polymerase II transcription subunit 25 n=1 Tax=Pholiota conissans TaxID=109636 RepID=A0A9P6D2U8_9AGAR|nr:hypothetical protein BDN70DRAFT_528202 [Pholiota conissans]
MAMSSLFRSSSPHQPLAILMLIENSLAMSKIWADLRDQYLDRLVETATSANGPTTPITVSVLESYPCQDHGVNPSHPRQYSGNHDGLRDVKFNPNPDNQISIGRINSCIDFLDSFKFQGQPAALHLIIVAASPPSDDNNETCVSPGEYSPWIFLAKKMAERSIHCHIVVSPQNATGSLTTLFEETLRMQANMEEQLYPPVDPSKIVLRLSASPTYQVQHTYSDPAAPNLYSPPERLPPSLPRRSSYPPPDNLYSDPFMTPAPTDGESPSLVSQLQQVHGLTKKKVYGAKPVRQPFLTQERIREKYIKAPTLLTMPPPVADQAPSPTAGGKALSHSRADRMARVGQSSPTETHSRRQHGWPKRGSRLSTPEAENIAWSSSPSTYHDTSPGSTYVPSVSSDISSPVTPVTTMEDMYHGLPKTVPSTSATAIHGMNPLMYQTGGMPEPSWPQQQQQQQQQPQQQPQSQYADGYGTVQQSYFPPLVSQPQFYSNAGELMQPPQTSSPEHAHAHATQQPTTQSGVIPSASYATYTSEQPPPIVRSQVTLAPTPSSALANPANTATSSAPDNAIGATHGTASATTRSSASTKRRASLEDEERFTFSQDFVAATAALFEAEVLPAYPNYPGMSSGLAARAPAPLPAPGPQTGELYASRMRSSYPPPQAHAHVHAANGHAAGQAYPASGYAVSANAMVGRAPYQTYNAPAYPPPSYGNSLTGWAG